MTPAEPEILFHLKMVAKIALGGSAISLGVLAWLLFYLAPESKGTYFDAIATTNITDTYLTPALIAAGLFIVSVVGIVTWLIALYSSFRIAGPLFRLTRNLQDAIEQGPQSAIPIRKADRLQQESKQLADTIRELHSHYESMRTAAAQAESAIQNADQASYAEAVKQLHKLGQRATL